MDGEMSNTLEPFLRDAFGLRSPECSLGPRAFMLPTTRRVLDEASAAASMHGLLLVGGASRGNVSSPAAVLKDLRAGPGRPDMVVLSDQLGSPALASILARAGQRSIYLSAFEFILNDRYGYQLQFWGHERNAIVERGHHGVELVAARVIDHLDSCSRLGAEWLQRDSQADRDPVFRRMLASRKLRFLRSAVANAFMADPGSPAIGRLMDRIAAIEAGILPGHSA